MSSELRRPLLDEDEDTRRRSRRNGLCLCAALLLVASVIITMMGVGFYAIFRAAHNAKAKGVVPGCRKSPALAIYTAFADASLPDPTPRRLGALPPAAAASAHARVPLVGLWSGKGKRDHMYSDYFEFDLQSRRWRQVRHVVNTGTGGMPPGRWKAAVAGSDRRNAMLVMGGDPLGDYPTASTLFLNDTWMLQYAPSDNAWAWQQLRAGAGRLGGPLPRRAHSAATFIDSKGQEVLLVFGGKTLQRHKHYMNDVWALNLEAKHLAWQRLFPPPGSDDVDIEYDRGSSKELYGPDPRKGSVAVMWGDAHGHTLMLVHGGRNGNDYYKDLWAFNLTTLTWEEWTPTEGVLPAKRDHHAAAQVGDSMVIHAGRSGDTHLSSMPLSDMWAYDLKEGRRGKWRNITASKGPSPSARYLHALAAYKVEERGQRSHKALIFGGQSWHGCYLNDLWELDVEALTWQQLHANRFCQKRCKRLWQDGLLDGLSNAETGMAAAAGEGAHGEGCQEEVHMVGMLKMWIARWARRMQAAVQIPLLNDKQQ